MEQKEPLESRTLVSQLSDSVQYKINNLFANCIVATGVVVGSVFLASDQLLWVEQLAISARSYFV